MTLARRALIGAIVIAALGAGSLLAMRALGGEPDVPIYRAERGRFLHRVEAEGVFVAEQATVLATPASASGPMKIAWMARDGSAVEAGDVVIRFDPTDMERELFTGQADRAKAASQIDQKQYEQGAALENLGRDARLAERQLEHALEFRTTDEEIFSRAEIVESQIDETLAIQRREHAEGMREVRSGLGEVELDLLDLEKRKAQLVIDKAEAGLQALEIRAPHPGIFVLRRDWGEAPTVGQMVWPTQPLAEIPQLQAMKAQVYVLEADAGGLAPGLEARVTLEAHPEDIIPARVRRVSSVAQRRARWSPVQYFDVDLQLERTDPARMKPGQRVRATLLVQDLEDVIAVPREALFRDPESGWHVWVRRGDRFEAVAVRPGPTALGRVVIEEGVGEGDELALADPTRLAAPSSGAPEGAPVGSGPGIQPAGGGR